jgi:hypothetical protein
MVEAGNSTDAVINDLVDAMEEGDIIIDGGNALYTDTIRREKAIRELPCRGADRPGRSGARIYTPAVDATGRLRRRRGRYHGDVGRLACSQLRNVTAHHGVN